MSDTKLERYRLLSRRPVLRLEVRPGRAPGRFLAAALAGCGVAGLAVGPKTWLFVLCALAAVWALAAVAARERWTIGARGVRFERAPWWRAVERPREAFERVSLRCVVANGDPVELPWQVALEDGDGSGLFVFAFQGELAARVVGHLVVEALELERIDGGDVDPEIAAAVRDALARI